MNKGIEFHLARSNLLAVFIVAESLKNGSLFRCDGRATSLEVKSFLEQKSIE